MELASYHRISDHAPFWNQAASSTTLTHLGFVLRNDTEDTGTHKSLPQPFLCWDALRQSNSIHQLEFQVSPGVPVAIDVPLLKHNTTISSLTVNVQQDPTDIMQGTTAVLAYNLSPLHVMSWSVTSMVTGYMSLVPNLILKPNSTATDDFIYWPASSRVPD
jgi:hypothetical protein